MARYCSSYVARDVFGDYVSIYDFQPSIQDGATVPLYNENRTPELQLVNPDLNDDIYRLIEDAGLNPDPEAKLEREARSWIAHICRLHLGIWGVLAASLRYCASQRGEASFPKGPVDLLQGCNTCQECLGFLLRPFPDEMIE